MNPMTSNPSSWSGGGPIPAHLKELTRPVSEVLDEFIHHCSPDPAIRTAAITALVLGLWQSGGRDLTPKLPSMILLRPEGDGPDPIDQCIRALIHDETDNEPRVRTNGRFPYLPIESATLRMRGAMRRRQSVGERNPYLGRGLGSLDWVSTAEEEFRAAQTTGYGHGRCRSYRKAWHPEFGLLTDQDDQLVLRLNDEEDRSEFCRDLLDRSEKILLPRGVGANLFSAPKTVSFSGSLTPKHWTWSLARTALESGLPFLVVPHVAEAPLREEGRKGLECFSLMWIGARHLPAVASLRLPTSPWIQGYHLALRRRLAVLPVAAEFPVLQAIHQLEEVCGRIVDAAMRVTPAEGKAPSLLWDLFHHSLRGLVIGVASHTWFGQGLMPGEKDTGLKKKAVRLLRRLRQEGSATKTDLLKNYHLSAHDRDRLVDQLGQQDLVRLDGSTVAATTYRDFVEGLYARTEFPEVEPFEQGSGKKPKAREPRPS